MKSLMKLPLRLLPIGTCANLSSDVVRTIRPVSVEFHGEFYCIKYADMAKRENARVSWDVRRVSSP
jgi:hypothetical protein